ncbi:hypothetical protein [Mycobacterium stomatepiae]|uniref:hypothetical protein n=1 Tax=Mycobacterium stomatepiae TaxID=470076 RepID=UPI0013D3854F|nr:hypothetical protein [Mycobacterium stomatepiae]MCV7164535.1 hypothetical protein [Mycobacterium stomatepiae]
MNDTSRKMSGALGMAKAVRVGWLPGPQGAKLGKTVFGTGMHASAITMAVLVAAISVLIALYAPEGSKNQLHSVRRSLPVGENRVSAKKCCSTATVNEKGQGKPRDVHRLGDMLSSVLGLIGGGRMPTSPLRYAM